MSTKAAKARRERLDRRNETQRAYRARPGRAAVEARASRRSYWARKIGYGRCGDPAACDVCARLRREHDL